MEDMDIRQIKQNIDASRKKLLNIGNEYVRQKDEVSARKVLVKMLGELSNQISLLAEQAVQMDSNKK
jgi:hypothetical protein